MVSNTKGPFEVSYIGLVPTTELTPWVSMKPALNDSPGSPQRVRFCPQALGLADNRIELHPGADGVADSGKGVVDVKVAVAVVAVGADKHHAFLRQVVDELVAQCGAVGRAPLGQSPAVVDDQTLAIGLRHASHPLKRVEGCGLVDHQRGEEHFGGRCHAGQPHAGATSGCDAGHVRAMGGVAVHVGGVAFHRLDVLGRGPLPCRIRIRRAGPAWRYWSHTARMREAVIAVS